MDPTTSMDPKYIKVRNLAQRFVKDNPSCIAAVPHDSNSTEGLDSSVISICLYMHTNGRGITDDFREEAIKKLANYNLKFIDLECEPLDGYFTPRNGKDQRKTAEMAKLGQSIEKTFSIFENRLNVTAVYPAYKISEGKETNYLCITVAVLGKGQIPAGEDDFKNVECLDGYPFDIVEGYFVPTDLPFLSSKSPLNFGVGIAVRGKCGAGTLGAFLTDGENYYALSCKHVLSKEENRSEERRNTLIEQPANEDYDCEMKNLEAKINKTEKALKQARNIKECESKIEELESELSLKNDEFIRCKSPRHIATYSYGVRGNRSAFERKFFVDAGIAIITNSERNDIQSKSNTSGSVYSFERNANPINGEIVSYNQIEEKGESAKFWKCGRTTGLTENARLDSSFFFKDHEGYKQQECFGDFEHVMFGRHCDTCAYKCDSDLVKLGLSKKIVCTTCHREIYTMEQVNELWAYNCFLLCIPTDVFSVKGDSGAVVFDEEGRAWGIIVGNYVTANTIFTVACSLDIAIRALSEQLRKELRLWLVTPVNVEPN